MDSYRRIPYGQIMPRFTRQKQLLDSTGNMIEPEQDEPTTKEQLRMRQIEIFDSVQTQIIENLQKRLLEMSEGSIRDANEILNLTLAIKENIGIIENSNSIYPMYVIDTPIANDFG
jgi:hypothetical protein